MLMIGGLSILHGEQDTKLGGWTRLVEWASSDDAESLYQRSPAVVFPK